ncbi:MAG: alpha/beta hydrolase [Gammaproteobacteria bacterium]|nr:MAG: alpha/beta hydrolase [Gammaproteobacteria bacterium]
MTQPCVCFSHGKESGPWGTKIQALAEIARAKAWAVESLDYQGMDDPQERVDLLVDWCRQQAAPIVLAGSSMGGHVTAAAANIVVPAGLFLMAPAFYVSGYEQLPPEPPACPLTIVHGWRDEIIPWQNSVRYGETCHATLVLLDSDHRLTDVLDEVGHHFSLLLDLISESI